MQLLEQVVMSQERLEKMMICFSLLLIKLSMQNPLSLASYNKIMFRLFCSDLFKFCK